MDCKEAAYLIDKKDTEKLSFWKKLTLKFHNFMCKNCAEYQNDSNAISKMIHKIYSGKQCLSCEEKSEMKENLSK